jgi:hypothetical protein
VRFNTSFYLACLVAVVAILLQRCCTSANLGYIVNEHTPPCVYHLHHLTLRALLLLLLLLLPHPPAYHNAAPTSCSSWCNRIQCCATMWLPVPSTM